MSEKEYWYSTDEEWFSAESVEELGLEDGDTFYRCERQDMKGCELITGYMADSIIEQMQENLWEEVGESAGDRLSVSDQAVEKLHMLLRDWANKHAEINCWKAINVKEFVFDKTKHQGGAE